MRVLHLIDDPAPHPGVVGRADGVLHACRLLHGLDGHDHGVCIVGNRDLAEEAERVGLNVAARVPATLRVPWMAWRALRRVVRHGRPPDVVHCWSPATLLLARLAVGAGAPRCAALLDPPPPDADARRRAAARCAGALVAACNPAAREEWVSAGIDEGRVVVASPPVTPGEVEVTRRGAIRRRLGLSPVETAVLLVGDHPHADGVRFVFLLGLLGVAGVRFTGVLPRGARQFDRGVRYSTNGARHNRLIVSDLSESRLLPGMDAAVIDGGGIGPTSALAPRPAASALPIARAHAVGVPVVAPAWADDERLYPREAAGGLLAINHALPELARVLRPIVSDRGRRITLGRLVRENLTGWRPGELFVAQVGALWARAARPGATRGGGV
ncbi:MAG: glycosyltransferase [Phycisphaerales bacterium]